MIGILMEKQLKRQGTEEETVVPGTVVIQRGSGEAGRGVEDEACI